MIPTNPIFLTMCLATTNAFVVVTPRATPTDSVGRRQASTSLGAPQGGDVTAGGWVPSPPRGSPKLVDACRLQAGSAGATLGITTTNALFVARNMMREKTEVRVPIIVLFSAAVGVGHRDEGCRSSYT